MNVSTGAIDNFVMSWDDSIDWTQDELDTIRGILGNISLNNGGRVKYDVELDQDAETEYFLYTVNTALQKAMNNYARTIMRDSREYYYVPNEGVSPSLDFLEPSRYVPKLDINRAGPAELEKLPGIGPRTAQRIIEHRNRNGFFSDITGVMDVRGIGSQEFGKFKYSVYTGTSDGSVGLVSPLLAEFRSNPTFAGYIRLIISSGGRFTADGTADSYTDSKDIIISELEKIESYIARNCYPPLRYRRMKASSILKMLGQSAHAGAMEDNASRDIAGVSVLDDTEYLDFVRALIASAQDKVRIVMFFMRYEDEKKYPTDTLFDELKSAKERGVDIKVILDKDAEGEVFGSRVINKEAYDFFSSAGIEVTYDFDEQLTHTKMVLVDGTHTVIGSHNWTAGSFYAYDDKSIYIDSKDMAVKTGEYFDDLWSHYTANSNARFTDIRELEEVNLENAEKLELAGICNTLDLLNNTRHRADRTALSERTGISEEVILKLANIADLMRVKGISESIAYMLEELGVDTVPELGQRKADSLYASIEEACRVKPYLPLPKPDSVSDWVEQAGKLERMLEY